MGTAANLDVVDQDRRLVGAPASDAVHTFRVDFSDAELAELRRRISATRWPDRETVTDQSQNLQLATLQKLVRYWETEYDWRKVEARLNAHNTLDAPLRTSGAIQPSSSILGDGDEAATVRA